MSAQTKPEHDRVAGDAVVIDLRDVFRVHRTAEGDAAALRGVSLTVARGEQLCVLGPSGAGKSTLLRVIAGLEEPSAGAARVLGRDMGRISARSRGALRRRAVGFLDQRAERNLPPDLPVHQGIVLALALRGVGRAERRLRADALLEAVSLADRARALPGELSGGERQVLALCAALAHRPALLLADEPTGELDDLTAAAVRELIAGLGREQEATVIVVSHDPAMAAAADRTLRLHDGRIADEQRAGTETLVLDRGGWLRLPPVMLAAAGISGRATAHVGRDGLTLRAAPVPARGGGADTGGQVREPPPAAEQAPAALECRSLVKGYGRGAARRPVIAGLSIAFAPAGLTVVTGRSGSGKSTLLGLLAGIEKPDGGDIVLDGRSLVGRDAEALAAWRRSVVGFLGQEVHLAAFLSARENVELAQQLHGFADRPGWACDWLARLGLADRADQRVSRLSAGERQRVGLARALACARGLLLVDEPTSRLDEASTAVVAETLVLAARSGQTVICATHEPIVIARADQELALGRARDGQADRRTTS